MCPNKKTICPNFRCFDQNGRATAPPSPPASYGYVVESHYRRKDGLFEFLRDGLNKSRMYRLYIDWCNENRKTPQKQWSYFSIFDTRFNLKFNRPLKDVCDTCTKLDNFTEDQRTSSRVEKQNEHLSKKDRARKMKQSLKEKAANQDRVVAAAFDIEKVMLLPHGECSSFYYSRIRHVTNFIETKINSMDTFCFLWHERETKNDLAKLHLAFSDFQSS